MMSLLDDLALALATFRAHALRSMLTLLGIVIGACTVVAMMSLTEGLRLRAKHDLAELGASSFQVRKWPITFSEKERQKFARRPDLTREQGEALMKLPHVQYVSIEASHLQQERFWTSDRATNPNGKLVGATPGYEQANGISIARGRFYSDVDAALGRRVAVLGADVAELLFPGEDPVGREIRIRQSPFTVLGVAERKGSVLGLQSRDIFVVIPLDALYLVAGRVSNHNVTVQATSPEDLPAAMEEVTRTLRYLHGLSVSRENDFEVFTNESFVAKVNDIAAVVTAATFAVCVLSLLVGGIGIMNIMLVSVSERTREIGVRRALGARRRRIMGQFVMEATALSLAGSVLGVLAGMGLAIGARTVYDVPASIPPWAVMLSLVTASGCGLVFGTYPALRASRIDPVEAMRSD